MVSKGGLVVVDGVRPGLGREGLCGEESAGEEEGVEREGGGFEDECVGAGEGVEGEEGGRPGAGDAEDWSAVGYVTGYGVGGVWFWWRSGGQWRHVYVRRECRNLL